MKTKNQIIILCVLFSAFFFIGCEDKRSTNEIKSQSQQTASDILLKHIEKNNINLGWNKNKLYIFSEFEQDIDKDDKNFIYTRGKTYDGAMMDAYSQASEFIANEIKIKDTLSSSKININSKKILNTLAPIKKIETYIDGKYSVALLCVWEQNKILNTTDEHYKIDIDFIEDYLSKQKFDLLLGSKVLINKNIIIVLGIGTSNINKNKYTAKKQSQIVAQKEIASQLGTQIRTKRETSLNLKNDKAYLDNENFLTKKIDIDLRGLTKIKSKIVKEKMSNQEMMITVYAIQREINR